MRYAVADFGALGVVEPIHRTDEVARDAPDALEFHPAADFSLYDGEVVELTHGGYAHTSSTVAMLRWGARQSHHALPNLRRTLPKPLGNAVPVQLRGRHTAPFAH